MSDENSGNSEWKDLEAASVPSDTEGDDSASSEGSVDAGDGNSGDTAGAGDDGSSVDNTTELVEVQGYLENIQQAEGLHTIVDITSMVGIWICAGLLLGILLTRYLRIGGNG